MDEKKSIKVSLGTTICIFIIILLIVALGVVYYLGYVKNNEKINELENKTISLEKAKNQLENQVSNLQTKNTKEEDKVLDKDLYAQGSEYFVFIENGTAYYKHSRKIIDSEAKDFVETKDLAKNVKRVKIFNLGTDISDTVFLILEDGTVKTFSYNNDLQEFKLLKDYKVEDILSAEGEYYPGNSVTYRILLKDGTTKEVIDTTME